MKSIHEKQFRADTEEKNAAGKLSPQKTAAICTAVAAIAFLLLFAGIRWAFGGGRDADSLDGQLYADGRIQEEMQAASAYLEKLDGSIEENRKKLEEVSSRIGERQDALLEVETTQKKLTENAAGMTEKVTQLDQRTETNITRLQERMDSIRGEIQATLDQVREMIASMEKTQEQNGKSMEEITKINRSVEEIRQEITEIQTGINQTYEDLKLLIRNMDGQESTRYQELLSELTGVKNSLKNIMDKDLEQLMASFSGMSENIQKQLSKLDGLLNGKLDDLASDQKSAYETLKETVVKHLTEIVQKSDAGTEDLKAYLDLLKGELQQELNQVFTSVSNGKKGLASALLTKGVAIAEDATFGQLMDAILRIEQKIVIGVQEIPGSISYEYHYHVNAQGENPHEERQAEAGGCYTVPCLHVHSDAQGCYKTERYHSHTSDCPGHAVWVDWTAEEPYWGWEYECGNRPLNSTRKVRICKKSTNEIDGYAVSCGLIDGQIVGATIVYDREAVQAGALTELPVREETEPDEETVVPEADSQEEQKPPHVSPELAEELERQRKEEQKASEEPPTEETEFQQQEPSENQDASQSQETEEEETASEEINSEETTSEETMSAETAPAEPEAQPESLSEPLAEPEAEPEAPTEETGIAESA